MKEILHTLLFMLNAMSPYILLGFLLAGLLHAFVPVRLMSRHLSGSGWRAVVKAAALGVPLPLCSCGVLPTAVALRRGGASRAATTSFLIATPQTGVDSIAATYALLGPAFAVLRPVAALVTALVGGLWVGRADRRPEAAADAPEPAAERAAASFGARIVQALRYGFFDMVRSIGKWLVIGLIVAALITVLVPDELFVSLGDRPLLAMLAIVVVAVPMYLCATGSIPIALSLMLKGLSPGAAFVLLMAGPAVNFASVAVITRNMGRRAAALCLISIVAGAMGFGLAVDYLLPRAWFTGSLSLLQVPEAHGFPIFDTLCSAVLVSLLLVAAGASLRNRQNRQNVMENTKEYKIKGMHCAHCKMTVEKGLAELKGVRSVQVDLFAGTALVTGDADPETVRETICRLGFDPVDA